MLVKGTTALATEGLTKVGPDQCCHMVSLGHNELTGLGTGVGAYGPKSLKPLASVFSNINYNINDMYVLEHGYNIYSIMNTIVSGV